ncbi:MAG: tetratricopeptide repeat protein [Candidatus Hodarchaeales archaeon]
MIEETEREELQTWLLKGQYKKIIERLETKKISIDDSWMLVEAYLGIGNLKDVDQNLNQLKKRRITSVDHSTWNYYNGQIFIIKGKFNEAKLVFQQLLEKLPIYDFNTGMFAIKINIQLGICNWRLGQNDKAEEIFNQQLKQLKEFPGTFNVLEKRKIQLENGRVLHYIGNVLNAKGDLNEALKYYKKAQEFKTDNLRETASTLNNIALIFWKQGKLRESLNFHHKSLKIKEKYGNKQDLSVALNNIALVYIDQGQLKKALNHLQQSLTLKKQIGNKQDIAMTLNNIAYIYRNQGQNSKALEYYEKVLSYKKVLNPQELATTLNNMAVVYHVEGKLKRALDNNQQALKIKELHCTEQEIASTLNNIASIYRIQGKLEDAINLLMRALDLKKNFGNPRSIAFTLDNIGIAYRIQGRFKEAQDYHERALNLFKKTDNQKLIAKSLLEQGITQSLNNELTELSRAFQQFPSPPYESPLINAYKNIILALLDKKNNKIDNSALLLQQILVTEGLEFEYLVFCHELLADIALRQWQSQPITKNLDMVLSRLDAYEKLCSKNQLIGELCKVFFLRAKLSEVTIQFSEAEKWLYQCLNIAEEKGLPLHKKLALEEIEKLQHKKELVNFKHLETGKVSVDEFVEYFNNLAKLIMEQDLKKRQKEN